MKPKIDPLESPRLLLENRKEFHAAEVFIPLCEHDLYHYMVRDVPPSAEWLADGFKNLETLRTPHGEELCLGWIGRNKLSKEPIGIFEMTIDSQEAFISYIVFKNHWGKGYAAEAAQAMIDYVSKNFEVNRFIIEMDTRNRASTKVAEKLGFSFMKVTSNAAFLKNYVSHEFQFQKLV